MTSVAPMANTPPLTIELAKNGGHSPSHILHGEEQLAKFADILLKEAGLTKKAVKKTMRLLEQLEPEIRSLGTPKLLTKEDLAHQMRDEDIEGSEAQIPECRFGCNMPCCDVSTGSNRIFTTSAAWDAAKNKSHMLIDGIRRDGGLHVSCMNGRDGCTGCAASEAHGGEVGAKFDDCNHYPYFLSLNKEGKVVFHVAENRSFGKEDPAKCGLSGVSKFIHLAWTADNAGRMFKRYPQRRGAYVNAHKGMVGYRRFDPRALEHLNNETLKRVIEAGTVWTFTLAKEFLREHAPTEGNLYMDQALMEYAAALGAKSRQAMRLVDAEAYRFAEWRFNV
jgi:hypothetical protein